MKNMSERFWAASVQDMQNGYLYDTTARSHICLLCGEAFLDDVAYQQDGSLHLAARAVEWHIAHAHGSMFDYLLTMNKQYTGLTELQTKLLISQKQGLSDKEIAAKLQIGSTSTIRNHRFRLREREKQAKVFLAIMGLLCESTEESERFVDIHRTANMVDERFAITENERDAIIKRYFADDGKGPLSHVPLKEKKKIVVLQHIFTRFSPGRIYTEKEVNGVLMEIYADFAYLRRLLVEYGFLDRKRDGSAYWVKV